MTNKLDVFDENYVRNLTDKWLTNIVIPQVYDDSLSYYEEINKLIGCLSDISKLIDDYREKLLQEVNDRIKADASLQASIGAEKALRENADTTLQANIDAEATDRENADNTLTTKLNKEIQDRTNADTTLQANIDAEKSSRESADNTLTTSLKSKLKWQWTSTNAFIESLTISDENNV